MINQIQKIRMKSIFFTLIFILISVKHFSQTDNKIIRKEIQFKNGQYTLFGELLNPATDKKIRY